MVAGWTFVILLSIWTLNVISEYSIFSEQTIQSSVFRTFTNESFAGCKFKCRTKQRCVGIMYRRHVGLCMLVDDLGAVSRVRNPKMVFSRKQDWEQDNFDEICKDTCNESETCLAEGTSVSCEIQECSSTPVTNGNITKLGNIRKVGSEIFYRCHGVDEATGSDVISTLRNKCKTDGDWLYDNIDCYNNNLFTYIYEGCFEDRPQRVLNDFHFYNSSMTIFMCASLCYERGHPLFGVQYYRHCFCGSALLYEVPVNNCTTPCDGAPSTFCGGPWAMGTYRFKPEPGS